MKVIFSDGAETIGGLTQEGLEFVVGNLRAADEEEIRATIYRQRAATAQLIWSISGPKWEARSENDAEPAAVGGLCLSGRV